MDAGGRVCAKCQTYKPWQDFGLEKRGTNGRKARCKKCANAFKKKRYQECPEYRRKRNAGSRRWLKENPERWTEYLKKYEKTRPGERRRIEARRTVRWAINTGRLHPLPCQSCGFRGHVHAHHEVWGVDGPCIEESYKREHWLNVQWLCAKCHKARHKQLEEWGWRKKCAKSSTK